MKCLTTALVALLLPLSTIAQSVPSSQTSSAPATSSSDPADKGNAKAESGSSLTPSPTVVQDDTAPKATKADVTDLQKQLETIKKDLAAEDPTFVLSLGIGSLVLNSGITDYSNNSNVLQSNNLGRATPQYLVGISMRSEIPNFGRRGKKKEVAQKRPKSQSVSYGEGDPGMDL
jgi:hypothetical protein